MNARNPKTTERAQARRIDELVRAGRNEEPAPELVRSVLERMTFAPMGAPEGASERGKASSMLVNAAKAVVVCSALCLGGFTVEHMWASRQEKSTAAMVPSAVAAVDPLAADVAFSEAPSSLETEDQRRPAAIEESSAATLDVHRLPSAAVGSASSSGVRESADRQESRGTGMNTPPSPDSTPLRNEFALELARLQEARAALVGRRIDDARKILVEYEKRFPNGTLLPEAKAMRIDALLAAGQSEAARVEAEAFVARYPSSPQAGRIKVLIERRAQP